MSLLISGDLRLRKTYVGTDDPDAAAYIAAVEQEDGEALETATRVAIHSFVKGCKADGIWSAIKASCILAGARTRLGALTPLVGTAPTSFNFVDGDYNRKTGLVGDGSTKYLDSNRNNNADPQDSKHISVFATSLAAAVNAVYLNVSSGTTAGRTHIQNGGVALSALFRVNSSETTANISLSTGFIGTSRNNSSNFGWRAAGTGGSQSATSSTPINENIGIFARATSTTPPPYGDCRLAFYSIGESLDLALLDARVTDLINAFGAAIP